MEEGKKLERTTANKPNEVWERASIVLDSDGCYSEPGVVFTPEMVLNLFGMVYYLDWFS